MALMDTRMPISAMGARVEAEVAVVAEIKAKAEEEKEERTKEKERQINLANRFRRLKPRLR